MERTGFGYTSWVLGWTLLVGALFLVVPTFFLFGIQVASWVSAGVLFVACLLTWLSFEAARALQADAERDARVGALDGSASKVS